jgi:imidazolonepropionase-like amidohydrolase
MDYQAALRGMTLGPAEVLGLDERLGSLDAGKDANILFFSGDPLEAASQLEMVMIDGNFVSDEVVR